MSQLYRAYYAIQGLTSKEGFPTNAIYGFTNMLRKMIKEENPTYVGVAVDLPGPTVRHELYAEYKSTRRDTPEDLLSQIPYVFKVCQVLRVPVLSYERYEADDVIATMTRKAVEKGLEVVIVTIDKDLFQLVGPRVSVLDTRTMSRFDEQKVEEKFGVPPDRILDILSLMGDTSDNIPGAPGIGEKGAQQLIQEYGTLQNLLDHRDEVSRKTYRESLQQNEAQIQQSRELLRIHTDLPLEMNLTDLQLSEPDKEEASALFTELNFISLLEEFLPEPEAVSGQYQTLESAEQLRSLAVQLEGKQAALALSYDDPLKGTLRGLAISVEMEKAFYLPESLLQSCETEVQELLKRPLEWVIHDLKPLYLFAHRNHWSLEQDFQDTMLMAYLLMPNQNNFSLETLALEYLHYRLVEGQAMLFEEDPNTVVSKRADLTFRLFRVLQPRLQEQGLESLLKEIEIPLVEVLASMEGNGVKVDCKLLQEMSERVEGDVERLRQEIYEIAGHEFNINSPRQLATVLFDKLGLPRPKKTRKAGHFATGVEVLEDLAGSYEIAQLILDYRELTKLKNTYLDALPDLVDSGTGRIHTSYNQMVAATGRLSSSNPNLQNIPIRSELGRQIRRAFVPEPGYKILAADYSQIELRVMAHLSEDLVLVDAFHQGEDVHERTAREVFGDKSDMDPRELRRYAKVINFGIMYGVSSFGLAQNLKIGRKEAQRMIDDYFERYQGVKKWTEETREQVYQEGQVKTLFGRIRPIPEVRSKNWNLRSFGERTAINAPIQGTAADLIKKAMVSIYKEMARREMKSRLILQVHDELVAEVEESEVDELILLIKEKMEGVAELIVPLQVDVAIGPSWYEAK